MFEYLTQNWDTVLYALILGGGGLWFAVENRAKLAGWLPSLGGKTSPVDADVLDLQAVKRIQARFIRLNCERGKAAVQTCLDHFFHAAGDHS